MKYIAAITANGIAEALNKEWCNKNPDRFKAWAKEMLKEDGNCTFKELTLEKMSSGLNKYATYLDRQREKSKRELKEIKEKVFKKEKDNDSESTTTSSKTKTIQENNEWASAASLAKKKRGRPAKSKTVVIAKRKRGRPRKNS